MSVAAKAGVIAGIVAGVFFWLFLIVVFWEKWNPLFSSIGSETHLPPSQIFVVEGITLGTVLLVCVVVSAVLGSILGIIYQSTAARLPVRSTYVKAVVFGYVLWLIPSVSVLLSLLLHYTMIFLIGLIVFELDACLFAYLADRWRKPV
jgi:hypothetical protein